eukprot:TRINITY_DN29360_c0_g1_i1.p2 TRINITY_DN29360_c0_g1~~TRINITY_DN29360_c0_g1_i1.p2  ORF type:complete len:145 (-),score=4.51 TRINITY_DN29360_c0_g1_i1:393-827(-)
MRVRACFVLYLQDLSQEMGLSVLSVCALYYFHISVCVCIVLSSYFCQYVHCIIFLFLSVCALYYHIFMSVCALYYLLISVSMCIVLSSYFCLYVQCIIFLFLYVCALYVATGRQHCIMQCCTVVFKLPVETMFVCVKLGLLSQG